MGNKKMLKLYERGDGEYRKFLQNVIEKKLTASEQGGTHCKQTERNYNCKQAGVVSLL